MVISNSPSICVLRMWAYGHNDRAERKSAVNITMGIWDDIGPNRSYEDSDAALIRIHSNEKEDEHYLIFSNHNWNRRDYNL